MRKFPDDPRSIIDAMMALCRLEEFPHLIDILRESEAEYEFLEKEKGTSFYRLMLYLPSDLFASLSRESEQIQDQLRTYVETSTKHITDAKVVGVTLAPNLAPSPEGRTGEKPISVSVQDADRIWRAGCFRLFISHSSVDKAKVSALRDSLANRYLSAFVAHEDIEPCREWQEDIRLGLASCHAMLAYITPEFHSSIWCMQEVGWALGRGVLVIPVKAPEDPKGLLGIGQALRVQDGRLLNFRDAIFDVLWRNDRTHLHMHEPLVQSIEKAISAEGARISAELLTSAKGMSKSHMLRLHASIANNYHIAGTAETLISNFLSSNSIKISPIVKDSEQDPFGRQKITKF